MSSEVQICNLALSHIGARRIQSLNDPIPEARECKLFYPIARDAALRDNDWAFARKRIALAQLTEEFIGWDYAYGYPRDCHKDREIWNGIGYPAEPHEKVPYEIASNSTLDGSVILTNEEAAYLVYTAKVTNVNVFDAMFIDAISFRLASDLAIPVKGKSDLQKDFMQQYTMFMGRAQVASANQGHPTPTDHNSFVAARS